MTEWIQLPYYLRYNDIVDFLYVFCECFVFSVFNLKK